VAFGAVVFIAVEIVAVPGLIVGEGAAVPSLRRRRHLRIAVGSLGVEGRDFQALLRTFDLGRERRPAVVEEIGGRGAVFVGGLLGLDDAHYVFVDCVGAEPGG
jgi:hypothetical protein